MSEQKNNSNRGDRSRDRNHRPNPRNNNQNNSVLNHTNTRRGEVQRASRRNSETVNTLASQHVIDIPVNKSVFNGYDGRQFSEQERRNKRPPISDGPILRVMPIGGLGEMGIGKNMMAIEYGNDIIVIDMGFLFPGADYPGINYIVPDISYLEERKHKIRGHIFTHGHLDHIGAFRHLIDRIPAPVYGAKFTISMLQKNMEEATSGYKPAFNIMNPEAHDRVQLGEHFSVELIRVNHSIPDATAVVIRTPVGVLIDTGDWRFEEHPVDGKKFDLGRLAEIAEQEKILLLMNESTNCEDPGTNDGSEFVIGESFGQIMDRYQGRIIISSFSSQIHRIQMILEQAQKHGRKVAFTGYSMIQNLEVALRSQSIKVPKDTIVRMDTLIKLPDNQVTIVCTGSQGEVNSALRRMATGSHRQIKVKSTDIVVLSSNPIPGNEINVVRTVDSLMREGSDVVQNSKVHLSDCGPLHMSGHGKYDDHVKLINTLKPKYYMPIHGEFHMLVHNAELAVKECGFSRDNILVCDSGDVVELTKDMARKNGRIKVGGVMYDSAGQIVSDVVLRDRLHMASNGMFIVVLTVDKKSGRLATSPDIISRGFIYMRDSEDLMNKIRLYLRQKAANSFGAGKRLDLDQLKTDIKDDVSHILFDETKQTPVVITVINEIGGGGNRGGNSSTRNSNGANHGNNSANRPNAQPGRQPIDPPKPPEDDVPTW